MSTHIHCACFTHNDLSCCNEGHLRAVAIPFDPKTDCSCPPPWGNDHSPSPICAIHRQTTQDPSALESTP